MDSNARIVVAGAGSVGCFIGGLLARAGRTVTLLGRPRVIEELERQGLRLTDLRGLDCSLPPEHIALTAEPQALREAAVVLVTVKSRDTAAMAHLIREHAPASAAIVSMQNGIDNPTVLRELLPGRSVHAAMIPFNVVSLPQGRFHRGTSGELAMQADAGDLIELLSVEGLPVRAVADIVSVQWGKLLLNLNNSLNALSGLTLQRQLLDPRWRRLLAAQMREALNLMRRAGIRPAAAPPIVPRLIPAVLALPTPLFRLLAGSMLRIDPEARSSMWEDLSRGRPTEIDQLQGVIVRLAERCGGEAPLAGRIVELVKAAERRSAGAPRLSPAEVAGEGRAPILE